MPESRVRLSEKRGSPFHLDIFSTEFRSGDDLADRTRHGARELRAHMLGKPRGGYIPRDVIERLTGVECGNQDAGMLVVPLNSP